MPILAKLTENRPNLSTGSLKTYESNLRNMYIKVYPNESIDLEKFNNVNDFVKYLEKMPASTRKGRYGALFVLTGIKEYNDLMREDIKEHDKIKDTQEQTEKQKENSITEQDLDNKMEEMNANLKQWVATKNLSKLQDFLILVLYGGYFLAPRRSADFVFFKLRNVDESKDNFLQLYRKDKKLHGRLVFNEFKTKQRGQDVIDIPDDLVWFLRKWKNMITSDYLFFNSKTNEQISNVVLNQRIGNIFNKKVGTSAFRHLYMTSKYGHLIDDEKNMAEDFRLMGSSILQKNVYIQKRIKK